jgi:hypothetical protein
VDFGQYASDRLFSDAVNRVNDTESHIAAHQVISDLNLVSGQVIVIGNGIGIHDTWYKLKARLTREAKKNQLNSKLILLVCRHHLLRHSQQSMMSLR